MFILQLFIPQFKNRDLKKHPLLLKISSFEISKKSQEILRVRDKVWTFLSIPLIGYIKINYNRKMFKTITQVRSFKRLFSFKWCALMVMEVRLMTPVTEAKTYTQLVSKLQGKKYIY